MRCHLDCTARFTSDTLREHNIARKVNFAENWQSIKSVAQNQAIRKPNFEQSYTATERQSNQF
jgi:hypothetical protein